MSFFKSASELKSSGPKSQLINKMNKAYGEFYAVVDECKVSESEAGTFAITQYRPIQLIGEAPFELNAPYHTMQAYSKKWGMMEQYMTNHVAAFLGKAPNHRFSTNDAENDAAWEEEWGKAYGVRQLNEDGTQFVWKGENPWKGAVLHIKVMPDDQSNKAEHKKKKDAQGNFIVYTKVVVLGGAHPDDLNEDTVARFGKQLLPSYQKYLGVE